MGSISARVALRASRVMVGKDFGSPEELEEYLKKHPDADRTKHKVDKAKAPKAPQAEPGAKKPPAPKPPSPPAKAKAPAKPAPAPSGKKPPPIPEAAKKKKPAPEAPSEGKPAPKTPAPKTPAKEEHDDHDDAHGAPAEPAGRFDGWKKSLKGLKDSAVKFVEKSPKTIKTFLGDPDFRKSALNEAKTAVTGLPKKAVHRLVETAKEEVHEFKTAANGIKKMISGGKMSKHEKHAFRQVATHLAIGATAAAFAATGPLVGAAVFTKNLATHVALKSVKKALGNLHTMNEVNHIGHGVMHLFEHLASESGSKKEVDPEEAMTNLILAAVAKEVESLGDDDFTQVLNKVGDGGGEDEEQDDSGSETDDEGGDKTAALAVLHRFQCV